MKAITLLIQRIPGGLMLTAFDDATAEVLWRGHCHPDEKDKTLAEALAALDGSSLQTQLRNHAELPPRAPTELDPLDAVWNTPALGEVIGTVLAKKRPNITIVDRSQ